MESFSDKLKAIPALYSELQGILAQCDPKDPNAQEGNIVATALQLSAKHYVLDELMPRYLSRKKIKKICQKIAISIREQICIFFYTKMEVLLNTDWEHTKGCIECAQNLFIGDDGTFLFPKPDDGDLTNNWGNRGGLVELANDMDNYTYKRIYKYLKRAYLPKQG